MSDDRPQISFFISYNHKDREIARDLAAALNQAGITFFLDSRDIKPGQDWANVIEQALVDSKHLLLIHTKNSRQSKHVKNEWNYFLALGKEIENIIPLAFDDTLSPMNLICLQHLDCKHGNFKDIVRKLENSILNIKDETETQEAMPVQEKVAAKVR